MISSRCYYKSLLGVIAEAPMFEHSDVWVYPSVQTLECSNIGCRSLTNYCQRIGMFIRSHWILLSFCSHLRDIINCSQWKALYIYLSQVYFKSMDDSSNGRAVAFYLPDPGSNPRSGSVWDHFLSVTCIDGCIMSDK